MATASEEKRDKHLAAVRDILSRDTITLTPDNVVNLLAYLQSAKTFQALAVRAIASGAAGDPDWSAIDDMVNNAELSDRILERLIERLSSGGSDDE